MTKLNKLTKLFSNTTIRSIDEENRTAEYIISTDEKDRMNEVVEQSWELENYKKNPIVLYGHDPSDKENVLGVATEIETKKDGDRTITVAKVQFADEGTSKGVDIVWSLVRQQILKTVSVGFIPHTFKDGERDSGIELILADNELLEFSIVPIPANPSAVQLALADGSISEKDAKWLIKNYKKEYEFLEKQLYDTMTSKGKTDKSNDKKEHKAMTDEEIKKLAEAIGKAVSDSVVAKMEEIETAKSAKSTQDDNGGADETDEDENEQLDEEGEKAYLESLNKDMSELESEDK